MRRFTPSFDDSVSEDDGRREEILHSEVMRLTGENERLSRENERLAKVGGAELSPAARDRKVVAGGVDPMDVQLTFGDGSVGGKSPGGGKRSEAKAKGSYFAFCGGGGEEVAMRQVVGLALILALVVVFMLGEQSIAEEDVLKRHRCLGILLVVIVLWLFEVLPIPITGLLVGPLLYVSEIFSLKDALSSYMGNLTMILFGSYFIAIAMERHGLDRRFAAYTTSLPCVRGSAWRERLAMMLSGWAMSMWVSNTGATNILTPILLRSLGAEKGRPFPPGPRRTATIGGLLSVAYGCNSGGMGTLVGTPPNMVAQKFLEMEGLDIDFFSWMMIGVPTSALVCCTAFLVLSLIYKPALAPKDASSAAAIREEGHCTEQEEPEERPKPLGKMRWGEVVVLASFLFTVFFWLFPSIYKLSGGEYHKEVKAKLPAGVVVILGSLPMYVIPDSGGRQRVLPWSDAKKADWGIIMLVGGGVALGKAMLGTGLAAELAEAFISWTGVNDIWTLTFVVIAITIFATEVASNTATTNIMVPIVVTISKAINPDPRLAAAPVMGVALAASCAFMMPIATPPNYIVMDAGHMGISDMLKAGIVVNVLCVGLIWLVLRVLVPIVFA